MKLSWIRKDQWVSVILEVRWILKDHGLSMIMEVQLNKKGSMNKCVTGT